MRFSELKYAVALLLVLPTVTMGQTLHATASGTCRDQTAAVVGGVSLTFRNLDNGAVRTGISDDHGHYLVNAIPLGRYRIEASKPGFRPETRTGVELTVGREAVLDFALQIGDVEERVEVRGEASQVETTTHSISALVDSKKISELPLNGRDIVQLIQLQMGVLAARSDTGDITTGSKGTRITVAGARPSTNVFMLDGTIINNLGNRVAGGATGSLTGVETIKEFRAYTNGYSAEFSRASGGAFNIITKSGGNSVHGSLFEFLRNDNLDARNFFDGVRPEFQRNQFGASIGGPIVRNRTFLFASYEAFRERLGQTIIRTIPDLQARNGVVNGVRIPIAAAVRPYLALYPQPTSDPIAGDGSALFTSIFNRPVSENFFNVRVDHQLSRADSLFLRYTFSDSTQTYLSDEVFPQYSNRLTNRPQFITLQETKILSPSAINEVRLGFARSNPYERPVEERTHTDLAFIPGESIGVLNISGFDFFGPDRNIPRRLTQNSYQFSDQFTLSRSRHTVTTGIHLERLQYNAIASSGARGEFRFASLSDFLRGSATTFEGLLPNARDFTRGFRQWLIGWYLQDAIRVSPRLTVQVGVRHEFVTTPTEHHDRLNNLRDPLDAAITLGEPFQTAKDTFAPRIGFALDPRGDGKTAIRGGFGMFYTAFVANQWFSSLMRIPPFAVTARATGADARFPNALAGLNAVGRESITALDYDHAQPYMLHFNFSVQRQIAPSTIATAAYVGSRGVNLGREADVNIGSPGNPVRRNPNFTRIRYRYWDARSFYNSLQTSLQRHFRAGMQFQLSYTLAKSVDDASSELGRVEFNNGQARTSDPFDRLRDRGLSSFDVRHNFVANFTLDVPWRSRRLAPLLKGWQISGISTVSSGIPFTPIITVDLDQDGTDDNEQRPNLKAGYSNNPRLGRPEQWFNPAAFESIARGTRGNLGRNTITGPGLAAVDVGVTRNFKIPGSEDLRLQFRAEGFNMLNRANFATPPRSGLEIFSEAGAAARPLPNVGRITSTSTSARQIQLALRLVF